MAIDIDRYLHVERLPHLWCPGCGIGTVVGTFLRSALELDLSKETTVVVGGIGCSSRAVGYLDFGTVHAIHGRALAFATGIKMARPEFTVVAMVGDGDGAAIGGNHLMHACRRNLDITCILINNRIYGMTGGQTSPQSGAGARTATAPYGHAEPAFDLCRLAIAAGAGYVARGTSYAVRELQQLITDGIRHPGFAFIEAMAQCPTEYGRRNPPEAPMDMLEDIRASTIPRERAEGMSEEELEGRIVIGLLHADAEAPELQRGYAQMLHQLRERSDAP